MFAVFGRVIEGMDVVKAIEAVPKGPGDKPKERVVIAKSGELDMPEEQYVYFFLVNVY